MRLLAIVLSVLSSISFFLGTFINKKLQKQKNIVTLFISFSLIVLIIMSFFILLPKAIDILNSRFITTQSYAYVFLMSLIGYSILKIVEYYIPEKRKVLKLQNFEKTAYLLTFTIFLYNITEGMNLYILINSYLKDGIIYFLKIVCFNVLFGMIISSLLNGKNTFKYLVLSNFIGTLLIYVFNVSLYRNFIYGTSLSIIFGMFVYIIIFNMWPIYKSQNKHTEKAIGLVIGGFIMLLLTLM